MNGDDGVHQTTERLDTVDLQGPVGDMCDVFDWLALWLGKAAEGQWSAGIQNGLLTFLFSAWFTKKSLNSSRVEW